MEWVQQRCESATKDRDVMIMYAVDGSEHIPETVLDHLDGYQGSRPVRIGNNAVGQRQIDVYGELMDSVYLFNREVPISYDLWTGLCQRLDWLAAHWKEPDEGIWEIRGQRQHFTYSKVSAWTAIDRAIKLAEASGADAPLDRWRAVRDEIHAEVLARGFDADRNTFVQYYGGKGLDASLLLIPAFGFLPADDPRVLGTIAAIQREICDGPFVWRYSTEEGVDGLAGSEGAFLICSFWLVSALAKAGRVEDAERNLEQLMALRNDVGLLSEEYDPRHRRLLGNFPQAFSHIGLLRSIFAISEARQQAGARFSAPK
jgi:GH15 family glucan-1,4-alpha-glucosidase